MEVGLTSEQKLPAPSDGLHQTLNMNVALQLLAWSGRPLPDASKVGQAVWLQAVIDGLCDLSSRDPLTGLVNRRQFDLTLAREVDRVTRIGEPALVLIIDIDSFKQVNDTFGHAVGDLVIKAVAHALMECVRPMDTVVRLGGDEFAVIVPNCRPVFGNNVAERIRSKVAQKTIQPPGAAKALGVTVSLGGAYAPPWVNSCAPLWAERADQQLYIAKQQGRNCACLEEPTATLSDGQRETVERDFSLSGY
jgi:diguanylate cyclase